MNAANDDGEPSVYVNHVWSNRGDVTDAAYSSKPSNGLTWDEIIACIAILTILALIALCLVYFCIKKYCCQSTGDRLLGGLPPLETLQHSSLSSSSLNHNSLPSIQRAVDGSRSPTSSNGGATRSLTPPRGRHARGGSPRAPARPASPGHRATGVSMAGAETAKLLKLNHAQRYMKPRAAKRSPLARVKSRVSSRLGPAGATKSTIKQPKSTGSPTTSSVGPSSQIKSVQSLAKDVIAKSQDSSNYNNIERAKTTKTANPYDQPITAEMIKQQTKDPQKEYSLFKSPTFYDEIK